jgi:hypothetical protein
MLTARSTTAVDRAGVAARVLKTKHGGKQVLVV